MKSISLPPRKADTLDHWETLCTERRLAYESNNRDKVELINTELMQVRLKGGWTHAEIKEEFNMYNTVLQHPFSQALGNPWIKYDLNDEEGKPLGLSLSLHQVGQYWKYRDIGCSHTEALAKAQ